MKKLWSIILVSIMLVMVACGGSHTDDGDDTTLYTVTFDANGGNPVPPAQTIGEGKTVAAPATNPTKENFVFVFWYLNGAATAYNFSTPVSDNFTLYAKWEEEALAEYCQVSWELNGGKWAANDNHATQVVKGGTLSEPTAPTKEGNTFEGWYTDAGLTNKVSFPYDVSAITANITLYAKWTNDGGSETPPTVMYIAGTDFYGACLWVVDLETDAVVKLQLNAYGEANDIVVSNGDVYISGVRINTSGKVQACYWKNGEETFLTTSNVDFLANGIAVSGNDVYVAGDENGSSGKPCYWKNGERTILPTTAQSSGVSGISVSGSDVYVIGWESPSVACYWKNGTKTFLPSKFSQSEPQSIFIAGTDVYVGGRGRYPGDWTACYWKNNSCVYLTDGARTASVESIAVSQGKVYAAGSEESSGTVYDACYWEDGRKVTLETSTLAEINDIAVSANKVYAVGNVWVDKGSGNGHYKACYWKDGVRIDLSDGKKESGAYAVALSWE